MSGGYAFVWDKNKTFESNFNPELSDIEKMSKEDEDELKGLIKEHLDATGSAVAKKILANWKNEVLNFKKVMPRDYKRVLLEKAAKAKSSKKVLVK